MDKTRGNLLNSHYPVSKHFNSSRRLRFNWHFVRMKTITSLPTEIILYIFEHLTVKDILNLQSSHPFFKDLVQSYPSIWKGISFRNIWPSSANIRHFEKAAELGNVESLIKLGVAYLYNEGFSAQTFVNGEKIFSNGKMAAQMFCQAENLLPHQPPFTWMFIRPPWAAGGACCKECVFRNMKLFAEQIKAPKVNICIAKTYELLDPGRCLSDILSHLQSAADQGSTFAQYLLWEPKYKDIHLMHDKCVARKSLRELREICSMGDVTAQLSLCRLYVMGIYGGYSQEQAMTYVRDFIQSSVSVDVRNIYECSELTPSMRHILVDWLVEVAYLRRYDTLVLHLAVDVVDRFLRVHPITRAKLQLLGIAAVVLCSRYIGQDIMTIREGAYLTDHTYSYEEVVRMMGEIAACLKGHIRKLTSHDFVVLIGLAACNDRQTQLLAEYFCEMSLQYSDLSGYTHGCLAASCVLLARMTMGIDQPWNDNLRSSTGHSIKSLTLCVLQIHKKCFLEIPVTDRRDTPLNAVKLRYSDQSFLKVAQIPMLTTSKLNNLLGVVSKTRASLRRGNSFEHDRDLIASPSRKANKTILDRSFSELEFDREKAATPTLEMTMPACGLNESGYDGDEEDGNLSLLDSSLELCKENEEMKTCEKSPATMSSCCNLSDSTGCVLPFSVNSETPSDILFVGQGKSDGKKTVIPQGAGPSPLSVAGINHPPCLSLSKRHGTVLVGNKNKKSMFDRWQNS